MKSLLIKQAVLISIFMIMTPIALGISLFALNSAITDSYTAETPAQSSSTSGVHIYAALPETLPSVSVELNSQDARVEIIRQYLEKYNSPLIGNEEHIVAAADEYGLDFRLITAIAQQESNLCKIIPPDTYNCWGWGIHSRGTLGFQSYKEGIYTVTKGIKENYIDLGYTTPEVIMSKYTPSSNGSWARGVSIFLDEMI